MPAKLFLQRRTLLALVPALVLLANFASARETLPLTNDWRFQKGDETNAVAANFPDGDWQKISLPHCWGWEEAQVTNKYYRGPGWYRRALELQPEKGKRYFLRFDAAATVADVFLNGQKLGEHRGGFGAFCFEITDALAAIASTGAKPLCERNYEVRVFGSKAILQLELWRGTVTLIDFENKRPEFPPLPESKICPAQAPALNFIDAIQGKTPNGSPDELGLASREIIEATSESAQTGCNQRITKKLTLVVSQKLNRKC